MAGKADRPQFQQSRRELSRWLKLWAPGAAVVRTVELGSGVGACVYGVEYREKKVLHRVALRVTQAPVELCWRESLVLNTLHDKGLPVSRCYGVQQRSKLTCLMLDWLPGKPVFRPLDIPTYVDQAAALLAALHEVSVPSLKRRFETGMARRITAVGRLPGYEQLADVLSAGVPATKTPVFLHGDFWPGNLLYQRKVLTGVVDLEDACIGSRMADLANARFELRWLWGEEASRRFTIRYLEHSGAKATDLARWDLIGLIRPILDRHQWDLNDSQERRIRTAIDAVCAEALLSIAK